MYHLKVVLCRNNEIKFNWILKWMAHICKFPWIRIPVVLVFRGGQGGGKSLFWERFARIFGDHGTVLPDSKILNDKFGGPCLLNKIFIVANEVEFGSGKISKGEVKNIITNPTFKCEYKYGDIRDVPNYLNMVWTSNDACPIPIELGPNRRFFLLNVSEEKMNDREYMANLIKATETEGLHLLYRWLTEKIHVDENDPSLWEAPMTEEKSELIHTELSPFQQFWRSLLLRDENRQYMEFPRDLPLVDINAKSWKMKNVSVEKIFTSFLGELSNRMHDKKIYTRSLFINNLKEVLPYHEGIHDGKDLIDLPSLLECKNHFFKIFQVECGQIDPKVIRIAKRKRDEDEDEHDKRDLFRNFRTADLLSPD